MLEANGFEAPTILVQPDVYESAKKYFKFPKEVVKKMKDQGLNLIEALRLQPRWV